MEMCRFCRLPRAELSCGSCAEPVCRACVKRLAGDAFRFRREIPDALRAGNWCPPCFEREVEPELRSYEETLARAREVEFWPKGYRGKLPILEKAREEVVVEDALDRDDALLTLGFRAAEQGYDGLIQGILEGRKVRIGGDPKGYQRTLWSGRALPVKVDRVWLLGKAKRS